MIITSDHLNRLHNTLKFLQTEFYKENQQLSISVNIKRIPNQFPCIETVTTTNQRLIEHDLVEMQSFNREYMLEILNRCKDELQSNLYSLSEQNQLKYLERYKQEFYTRCLKSELNTFIIDLEINGAKYLELGEKQREIIDLYVEEVSNLAYQWSYYIHLTERYIKNYAPLNDVTVPPRGIELREDLIFKILYIYDFDNTDEEIQNIVQEDENNQFLEELEIALKDKSWITFSEGVLLKYLSGNFNPKNDGKIEWLYCGKKKTDKTPSLIHLVVFSLILFTKQTLISLKNDGEIAKYISTSILHREFDKSIISRARGLIKKQKHS